ncbi:hypothetical protein [Rubrivirga sp.]|uniref:hypothetical protein n=1 Tax=Rubrivirga sp. TaxID=1885344 RepID=UPI003B51A043
MSKTRVCLVTTGHLSTNPRLVKEADALAEAGYAVRVVACRFWPWADAADAAFADRSWPVRRVRFGALAEGMGGRWIRVRHRLARELAYRMGAHRAPDGLLRRAAHYVTPELARAALAEPADLYIAHNLGALPAAALAAARHRARLGFDAEDFHRGELHDGPDTAPVRELTAAIEDRFLPRCDYVTAASDGIGQAYHQAAGIDLPTTVLNVFPLSDRDVEIAPAALDAEVPSGARSLHWFSQTIGPNRGLEDVVRALPELPEDVVLSLRGGWADGYEPELRGLADRLGVGHRLHALGHCPPDEVVRRAAQHDVGLALELGTTVNRDLCVTNKLFTYVLAGLPTVATSTTGQRGVHALLPHAVRLYEPGDIGGLVAAVEGLLGDPATRAAAREAGPAYSWDREKETFLQVVRSTTGGPSREGGRP